MQCGFAFLEAGSVRSFITHFIIMAIVMVMAIVVTFEVIIVIVVYSMFEAVSVRSVINNFY